ncbi:MAG: hypothetical protein S4CHLAM6_05120 [Chlamydiae bacterium]|nr:hypothetical protein [Chlamydiota bacterium]
MTKKLIFIYLALIFPLVAINAIQGFKLKKHENKQAQLLLLEKKIDAFTALQKQNESVRELYKGFNPEYLYTHLEQLPLANKKIQLIELTTSKTPFYIEKVESLASSVEVDLTEIQTVLECVEGNKIDKKPHLNFSEFSIKKNNHPENITYSLNFKLTKREYRD